LGTFTQKVVFLDYNKTKKEKSVTLWVMDCNLLAKTSFSNNIDTVPTTR